MRYVLRRRAIFHIFQRFIGTSHYSQAFGTFLEPIRHRPRILPSLTLADDNSVPDRMGTVYGGSYQYMKK